MFNYENISFWQWVNFYHFFGLLKIMKKWNPRVTFKLFSDSLNMRILWSMLVCFELVKENEKRLLDITLPFLRIMWTIYKKCILWLIMVKRVISSIILPFSGLERPNLWKRTLWSLLMFFSWLLKNEKHWALLSSGSLKLYVERIEWVLFLCLFQTL